MKVSISMVTYNHEQFIAKALDSVLMQKTDFDYEIVIGEDCSSDGTRAIVLEYRRRYPDIIRLFLNEKNLGMYANSVQVLHACTGEYVAILEGDDYWTSPDKLQKQVDFLENHPESVSCFHNVMIIHADKSHEAEAYCPPDQKEFSTAEDLLRKGNFIPACSKMFRRKYLEIPDWIFSLKMGDWPCDILLARQGNIGYLNEIMGVYVIHQAGAWYEMRQNWEAGNKANIEAYNKMYDFLQGTYKTLIKYILHDLHLETAEKYEDLDELDMAKTYAVRSLTGHFVVSRKAFKILLRLYAPALFNLLRNIKSKGYAYIWSRQY